MKTLFTTLIVLIITALSYAQEGNTLIVKVNNAKNDQGKMIYGIYTKDQFMKAAPILAASVEVKDGVAIATFENVPDGEYAIMVLHDLNGNEQMDFEANGMPKEDYGLSNNSLGYAPPTWEDGKVVISENTELLIRL